MYLNQLSRPSTFLNQESNENCSAHMVHMLQHFPIELDSNALKIHV